MNARVTHSRTLSSPTSFECFVCGASAFSTPEGVNYHGIPGEVDHDADADHVSLDPEELGG